MTLRDMKARHARGIMASTRLNGELVTRQRSGVADLSLAVTIKRRGREWNEEGVRVAFERAEVWVPAGGDVQKGDTLVFAMNEGGEPSENHVESQIRSGAGGTLWEVVR